MSSNEQSLPVIPSKETVEAGVFDKPSTSGTQKARVEHFIAAPGPAIPQDMSVFEKPASHEELRARAAELNKKQ